MDFKYKDEHNDCQPCPPPEAESIEGELEGFRFVANGDTISSDDFVPEGIESPARNFGTNPNPPCCAFGLSFFTTAAKARRKFNKLRDQSKKIARKKYLVRSSLTSNMGVITPPNAQGHFTLHESEDADPAEVSELIGEIS